MIILTGLFTVCFMILPNSVPGPKMTVAELVRGWLA